MLKVSDKNNQKCRKKYKLNIRCKELKFCDKNERIGRKEVKKSDCPIIFI